MQFPRIRSILVGAVILVTTTSCAPNNLNIRLAYSRLDNSIAKRLNTYASFDSEQKSWIESAAREYQIWHRKTELPGYAQLFDEVSTLLEQSGPVDEEAVSSVFLSLEIYARRSYSYSPFARSAAFLETLTDFQVEEIMDRFAQQDEEQLQHIREHVVASTKQDRTSRIVKNVARIGLKLEPNQEEIIRQGFARYIGKRQDRVTAWQSWQREFAALLKKRNEPQFGQAMQTHIDVYQQQMEIHYPERTARNHATTVATVTELVNNLNYHQRKDLVVALGKYSAIFVAMSASTQTTLL
jgi:hypothetical protein